MRSTSRRGLRSSSWLSWMPIWCSVDILRFSTNTSECSTSRMSSSRASGRRGSMVHDSLLRAIELFIAWRLYGRSSTPSIARRVHRQQAAEQHVRVGPGEVALGGGREHRRVLDPDHLGAEVGEQLGEVGPRPHRGEVEDPDAAQRRLVGVRRCPTRPVRSRRRHLDARLAAGGVGRRVVQPPAALGVAGTGAPGQQRPSPSTGSSDVDPEPALVEVVGLQHLGRACTPRRAATAPAWASAVASARVCSNSHGYSAVSRISLVSGSQNASGRANAARRARRRRAPRASRRAAAASTSSTRSRRRTGRRRRAAGCRPRSRPGRSGSCSAYSQPR